MNRDMVGDLLIVIVYWFIQQFVFFSSKLEAFIFYFQSNHLQCLLFFYVISSFLCFHIFKVCRLHWIFVKLSAFALYGRLNFLTGSRLCFIVYISLFLFCFSYFVSSYLLYYWQFMFQTFLEWSTHRQQAEVEDTLHGQLSTGSSFNLFLYFTQWCYFQVILRLLELWYCIWNWVVTGLPTSCLKNVCKLCGMLNVRVNTGHRTTQAQEVSAEKGRSSRFCSQKFICKIKWKYWNSRVLAGCFVMKCEKVSFKHI